LSTHACIHWYLGIQIGIVALLYVSEIVRGDVMHEEGERSKLGIGKRCNGPHPELLLNALFEDSTSLCTYQAIHPMTMKLTGISVRGVVYRAAKLVYLSFTGHSIVRPWMCFTRRSGGPTPPPLQSNRCSVAFLPLELLYQGGKRCLHHPLLISPIP
jgi:hypothetical protein